VGNGEWRKALREERTGEKGDYTDGNGDKSSDAVEPIKSSKPRGGGNAKEER
jgi:hypothetical protein